ncbi:hypothetical protein DFP72DRAFT_853996 [Ephemerocybe angulata]|uniref:Uncharacterized protein n=1 Tax=Ephemerocybe angulata TaxID=980116 RepID=A0A8H6HIU3_9AGAR|nr:hypothetical protein DFP72DRAFT_853996 [Tulosesus angulatus]
MQPKATYAEVVSRSPSPAGSRASSPLSGFSDASQEATTPAVETAPKTSGVKPGKSRQSSPRKKKVADDPASATPRTKFVTKFKPGTGTVEVEVDVDEDEDSGEDAGARMDPDDSIYSGKSSRNRVAPLKPSIIETRSRSARRTSAKSSSNTVKAASGNTVKTTTAQPSKGPDSPAAAGKQSKRSRARSSTILTDDAVSSDAGRMKNKFSFRLCSPATGPDTFSRPNSDMDCSRASDDDLDVDMDGDAPHHFPTPEVEMAENDRAESTSGDDDDGASMDQDDDDHPSLHGAAIDAVESGCERAVAGEDMYLSDDGDSMYTDPIEHDDAARAGSSNTGEGLGKDLGEYDLQDPFIDDEGVSEADGDAAMLPSEEVGEVEQSNGGSDNDGPREHGDTGRNNASDALDEEPNQDDRAELSESDKSRTPRTSRTLDKGPLRRGSRVSHSDVVDDPTVPPYTQKPASRHGREPLEDEFESDADAASASDSYRDIADSPPPSGVKAAAKTTPGKAKVYQTVPPASTPSQSSGKRSKTSSSSSRKGAADPATSMVKAGSRSVPNPPTETKVH